jgi:hypothetical protein
MQGRHLVLARLEQAADPPIVCSSCPTSAVRHWSPRLSRWTPTILRCWFQSRSSAPYGSVRTLWVVVAVARATQSDGREKDQTDQSEDGGEQSASCASQRFDRVPGLIRALVDWVAFVARAFSVLGVAGDEQENAGDTRRRDVENPGASDYGFDGGRGLQ